MNKWLGGLMMLLLLGVLAACSGGDEAPADNAASQTGDKGQEQAANPSNSNGQTQTADKAEINFWHSMGGANGERIDAMVKRFNESQSDVEVVATFQGNYDETVTKLQQSIASGTGPDVSMLERAYVQMFADSEVLADLTPHLSNAGLEQSYFIEGLMGHSYFNDQLVSLPLNRSTPIMHVNKTMLDELGLDIPTSWAELEAVANAVVVKEGEEITRYGMSMPYDTWYPIAMITQAGSRFFDEAGTTVPFVTDGAGEKVFQYLKSLQQSGALFYPPAADSGNIVSGMFTEGKIAILYQSTGSIGGLVNGVDFEYVTAFLPKDEQYATPTGGANVVMLEGSQQQEAAWAFMEWMLTEEDGALPFIVESGYLPVTHDMIESDMIKTQWEKEPMRQTAYEQLQYAIDTNKDVAWPSIMHEFFSAIEAIMYDSEDIGATLQVFQKEAERLLAE